jgi:hypothetical protein
MVLFFFLFGIAFTCLSIYAIYDTIKERINDRKEILQKSNEELISALQGTIYHLNSFPRILYRGKIGEYERSKRKLSLIKKQLKKRGFKIK